VEKGCLFLGLVVKVSVATSFFVSRRLWRDL
jgi:hypothetical protein